MQRDWASLQWTEWVALADKQALGALPAAPGFYRVGVVGREQLAYVGQTGRSLRERVHALARHGLGEAMPWNDPHTAAPGLWCYRHADGLAFTVSVAPSRLADSQRLGKECALLWRYWCETGRSPLLNLGHFHATYRRPSNRAQQRPGMELVCPVEPQAAVPPLGLAGEPEDPAWMEIAWSPAAAARAAPAAAGLYRLIEAGQVVYVGQAGNLRARLRRHAGTPPAWVASWASPAGSQSVRARLELECDLIGAFYDQRGCAPAWQFGSRPLTRSLSR